jgi:hypothetical protein
MSRPRHNQITSYRGKVLKFTSSFQFVIAEDTDECFPVIQSDYKKTPQLISFLFDIRFQRAIHQIKGFKKYYKLGIKCCP